MNKKCQFIEDCFAANSYCDEDLEKNCYQADLMNEKLKLSRRLPCPLCKNLKCDIPRMRALLDNPENCITENNKCKVREALPDTPAYKFEDAQRPSKKSILSGMEIMRTLNKLKA